MMTDKGLILLDLLTNDLLMKIYGYARKHMSRIIVRGVAGQINGATFEDYVQQALADILDGVRTIPAAVVDEKSAYIFITGVVRSLISNDLVSSQVKLTSVSVDDDFEVSSEINTEVKVLTVENLVGMESTITELRRLLVGKENPLKVLDAYLMLDEHELIESNKAISAKTGLAMCEVVAAKRLINRSIDKIKAKYE